MHVLPSLLLALPLLAAGAPAPAEPAGKALAAEVSALARSLVEPVYTKANGHGFSTFECDVPKPVPPGGSFDCDAVDEKGETARYTLAVDGGGQATIVLVSFPASRLEPEERAFVEPPCREFLDAYRRGAWKEVHATLHPALRSELPLAALEAQLGPARVSMGALRSVSLRSAAVRSTSDPEVRHSELAWDLDSEKGPGVARFRIDSDGEAPRVSAFRIYPAAGSALQASVLEAMLRGKASELLGERVARLAGPLEKLENVGDAVLGTAHLASGGEVPVRIEQSGRSDDFERNDFTCQVLDAPWLIRRSFASRSLEPTSVDCPSRVVPDDGSAVCDVRLKSGERYAVTIQRRGGEHRMTAEKAPDR
ncbi:MAG: hypothetical protein RBU36_07170 [Thermoanaerobaculia bacterium]|jgi:hypothetical protein|nr:hypothetical protein [Thermoanaerobaculia bacterium]